MPLQTDEVAQCAALSVAQTALGAGEIESVALCLGRGHGFLSGDRRARTFAESRGVRTASLHSLLRLAWERRLLSREEVENLVREIEIADRTTIRDVESIFATSD